MASPKQVLLIGGGLTAVVGGAGGTIAYFSSQPKNIGDLLVKKGKTLLSIKDNTNDDQWKKLVDKYKGDSETITLTGGTKINKIKNFTIANPQPSGTANFKDLKNKCRDLFKTEISKGEKFENLVKGVEDWCTLESPVLSEPDTLAVTKPDTGSSIQNSRVGQGAVSGGGSDSSQPSHT
ncbi:hypothetical protein A6V39_00175 [Candidatus Mycoplasma haematobovis]|uniref:Uncharacterized protein n=1 Tax=Candidatus Mycoplasma haematobovis TaxID=432608 RepID=A0A1A9QET0_9MOLU|nr:hypothetical protein [Candidatus Mycoplasma haematobovis]OAL10465.1 hypothetical protein A6V39_00175 [Candidatus Mycoplasma haematobovis]